MSISADSSDANSPRVWPARIVVTIFLLVVAVLANLQPCQFGGRLLLQASEQRHGLPLVYMDRSYQPPWADMSVYHGPWPFVDATPEIEGFSWPALLVNMAVALLVLLLAAHTITGWLGRRSAMIQSLVLVSVLIVIAMWGVMIIWGLRVAHLPWHSDGLSFPSLMFLWAVPVLCYLALMALVSVVVLRWILQPTQITAMQATHWLVALWLMIEFYINVAEDWFELPGRIDCASFIVTLFSAIAMLRLSWPVCCWSYEPRRRFAMRDPTLAGFSLLSWLAVAIMLATTIYFMYFDVTDYVHPDGGMTHFYGYGWPWIYLVSAETNREFMGYRTMDGWTIGEPSYLLFVANTVVLLCMSVATFMATTALVRIEGIRPAFSLARVFAVMLILSLPLALESGEARHVIWPNWYVHFVVSLGLAAVGYLFLRLIRWTLHILNTPDASTEPAIANDADV
jgi:hypothetical protein